MGSLALHGINGLGLTRDDRWFLDALCVDHMGGPVGLANLRIAPEPTCPPWSA